MSKGKRRGLVFSAVIVLYSLFAGKACLRALRLWLPGASGWVFWPLWLLPEPFFPLWLLLPEDPEFPLCVPDCP